MGPTSTCTRSDNNVRLEKLNGLGVGTANSEEKDPTNEGERSGDGQGYRGARRRMQYINVLITCWPCHNAASNELMTHLSIFEAAMAHSLVNVNTQENPRLSEPISTADFKRGRPWARAE